MVSSNNMTNIEKYHRIKSSLTEFIETEYAKFHRDFAIINSDDVAKDYSDITESINNRLREIVDEYEDVRPSGKNKLNSEKYYIYVIPDYTNSKIVIRK